MTIPEGGREETTIRERGGGRYRASAADTGKGGKKEKGRLTSATRKKEKGSKFPQLWKGSPSGEKKTTTRPRGTLLKKEKGKKKGGRRETILLLYRTKEAPISRTGRTRGGKAVRVPHLRIVGEGKEKATLVRSKGKGKLFLARPVQGRKIRGGCLIWGKREVSKARLLASKFEKKREKRKRKNQLYYPHSAWHSRRKKRKER